MKKRRRIPEAEDRCWSCRFAESIGQIAVFVTPDCPHGHLIRDRLVVPRRVCETCKAFAEVDDGEFNRQKN